MRQHYFHAVFFLCYYAADAFDDESGRCFDTPARCRYADDTMADRCRAALRYEIRFISMSPPPILMLDDFRYIRAVTPLPIRHYDA